MSVAEQAHARRLEGRAGKNKAIGFLSNTGPDLLENHKATKPAFNVGPSSARQRNAWWFAGKQRMTGF